MPDRCRSRMTSNEMERGEAAQAGAATWLLSSVGSRLVCRILNDDAGGSVERRPAAEQQAQWDDVKSRPRRAGTDPCEEIWNGVECQSST